MAAPKEHCGAHTPADPRRRLAASPPPLLCTAAVGRRAPDVTSATGGGVRDAAWVWDGTGPNDDGGCAGNNAADAADAADGHHGSSAVSPPLACGQCCSASGRAIDACARVCVCVCERGWSPPTLRQLQRRPGLVFPVPFPSSFHVRAQLPAASARHRFPGSRTVVRPPTARLVLPSLASRLRSGLRTRRCGGRAAAAAA